MIQPLRSTHQRVFLAMAVVVPAIVVSGLAARHPQPSNQLQSANATAGQKIFQSDRLWRRRPIVTTLSAEGANVAVEIEPRESLNSPDLLLYWTSGSNEVAGATLLGPLQPGRRYRLPARGGRLLIYSLAHRELLDEASLEMQP